MATKTDDQLHVTLTQAAEAQQGAGLVLLANGITITDRASHERCREFLKGAKALKKKIEEHYAAIKSPLNAARATVLEMEKRDLSPVLDAIAIADGIDTRYVREQKRIEQEAADEQRRQAEAQERLRREQAAAEAEAEASRIEASSNVLSEREQVVVRFIGAAVVTPEILLKACKFAGYLDPKASAEKLFRAGKIGAAVEQARKADAIRREAAAKQAEPINVSVPAVASQVIDGGVRTYYGCEGISNVPALLRKLATDLDNPANFTLQADAAKLLEPALLMLMSKQARDLKELFPRVWPMAQLSKRDGTVGR